MLWFKNFLYSANSKKLCPQLQTGAKCKSTWPTCQTGVLVTLDRADPAPPLRILQGSQAGAGPPEQVPSHLLLVLYIGVGMDLSPAELCLQRRRSRQPGAPDPHLNPIVGDRIRLLWWIFEAASRLDLERKNKMFCKKISFSPRMISRRAASRRRAPRAARPQMLLPGERRRPTLENHGRAVGRVHA